MEFIRRACSMLLVACAACADNGARAGLDAGSLTAAGASSAPTADAAAAAAAGSSSLAAGGAGNARQTSPAAGSGKSSSATAGRAGNGGAGGETNQDDADAGPPDNDASVAPRSTGPGDWVAGDYPPDLMGSDWLELDNLPGQNGNVRQYKVHVPPSYDPTVPMPVVFCIHGLGQDALLFCVSGADMPKKADSAGFLLVMPNGYQNSWNAGTCCGGAASDMLDDVAFMRAIFEEISGHLNIDLTRVYATGLSNGGYMSYRLACEASDLFVAVAPGSGAIGMDDIGGGTSDHGDFAACAPAQPVSVLDIHGTQDPLVPYGLQKPSLERISAVDGCKTTTHPASQPMSAGDTKCVSYDCPAGVEVTGCSVDGGGHVWFGSPNCGTGVDAACSIVGENSDTLVNTDAVWTFLSAHARD